MSFRTSIQVCFALGTIAAVAFAVGQSDAVAAQKSSKAAKSERPVAKRATRLPAYFASVIDDKQRAKIQAVQEEFGPKIQQLRDDLKELTDKQESAINKLITPKQRQQIEKLRSEARARLAAGTGSAADSEEMEDEPSTKSKSGDSEE